MILSFLLALLLAPALGQHGEGATEVALAPTSSQRLSCSNVTNVMHVVEEALEAQGEYNSTVVLNCCIESPQRVLMDAVVSVFRSPGDTGLRFEMHLVDDIDVLLPIDGEVGLRDTWNSSVGCFSCSPNASSAVDMCSACTFFCESCIGPANTQHDCPLCKFGSDELNAETSFCLPICNDDFDLNSQPPCSECKQGDFLAVKSDNVSEEGGGPESKYPFQSYDLRCVQSCNSTHVGRNYYEETEVEGSTTKFCFFGPIPYCESGSPDDREVCEVCHNGTNLFLPIISKKVFEKLKEEAEEKYHNDPNLEHLLEELEEKCVGPSVRCATPEMRTECFEMSLALQSTQLEVEIEEETNGRIIKDLALSISLPIICVIIIAIFVGLSVFAHLRYPHVHEDKRRRTEPAPELSTASTVWRPKSTVYLK